MGFIIDDTAAGTAIDHVVMGDFSDRAIWDMAANFTLTGSYIGVQPDGLERAPNHDGVLISGASAHVGGTSGRSSATVCDGDCNIISGNADYGIDFNGATGSVIEGNFIGVDASGHALGNGGVDIFSLSAGLTIGGTAPESANVIGGSPDGIILLQPTTVEGNLIGTDPTGIHAAPNTVGITVLVGADGSTIGGTTAGARNVISGNLQDGIDVPGGQSVQILDNLIGTRADGNTALPNGYDGIDVTASASATVGSATPGEGNVIAFNGQYGISVASNGTGNTIRGNSIHDNLTLGISRGTPPPVPGITQASSSGATGTGCPNCTIDVYSDSGGQGRLYEGAATADGGGNWTFSGAVAGPNATATATDPASSNTSGFSTPAALGPAPTPSPTPTPAPTPTPTPTQTPTLSPTPTPTITPTATPTPAHTPTPTPTPTPTSSATPEGLTQGDVDCSGAVTAVDALKELRFVAGLSVSQQPDCPHIGDPVASIWGDVDCTGGVNAVDALKILRHIAGLGVSQDGDCPHIGTPEGG